jgi:hypothetical protein
MCACRFSSQLDHSRDFCAKCGSYLAFTSTKSAAEVSVNTASFDEPGDFPPRKHIFVESRIAWFNIADQLPIER